MIFRVIGFNLPFDSSRFLQSIHHAEKRINTSVWRSLCIIVPFEENPSFFRNNYAKQIHTAIPCDRLGELE